jgi:error-prone DNA polymerase
MGFYSPDTLIRDAARHGLKTLPPCAVHSDWDTTVVDDRTIRLGLRSVKGLSERHIRALMEQRARRPFAGGRDFMRRAPLDADERRALAAVGALNVFYGHRRAALWHVAEQPDPDSLWAWADGEEEAENGGCSVEGETAKVEGEACEVGGETSLVFHLPPSTFRLLPFPHFRR